MRTARATQKQANMALEVGKSALLGVIISFVLVVLYAVALKEELLQVSTMGLFTTVIKVICAAAAVWGAGGYALRCTGVHSVFRRCGHAVREHSAAL